MSFSKPQVSAASSEGVKTPAPSLPAPYPGCWQDKEFMRLYKRQFMRIARQRAYLLRDRQRDSLGHCVR